MKLTEYALAECCRLGYVSPRELYAVEGWDGVQPFQFAGADSVVFHADRTAVVSFRGTTWSILKILFDLRFLAPKQQVHGAVHRGFSRAADLAEASGVDSYVEKLDPTDVFYVGHSLGGAVANHFAQRAVVNEKPWRSHLFTLGAPRVGTSAWANVLAAGLRFQEVGKGLHLPIVDPLDPIAHLPPRGKRFLPNYRHSGTLHFLADGTIIPADASEIAVLKAWGLMTSPKRVATAHRLKNYLAKLDKWTKFRAEHGLNLLLDFETEP